jgi:hypothetical protein
VIIDDSWALVGSSTFRRRGLTFDGGYYVALADTQLERGGSAAIAGFRRALIANRLGLPNGPNNASSVRLRDGVESFYVIREALLSGGLGKIERLWNGETPGLDPVHPATIDQANPEGREFDLATAIALMARAGLSGP